MSLLDGIGSALDSGAVSAAADVGASALESSDSWWDTALDWGTKAFSWMDDNPAAAKVLGGVATGAGTYLAQRDMADREERAMERQWNREREAQMIKPGNVSGYGSHVSGGGLLSNGMIAQYRPLRDRR